MALYGNAAYRAGYQGYMVAAKQTAPLVPVDADNTWSVTLPTPDLQVGLCRLPAWDIAENYQNVESIGSMRDVAFVPARREATIRTQILVSDFSMFANKPDESASYVAIRNHADPDAAGTVNGLQLVCIEVGTGTAYGNAFGKAGVDCLLNSLRVSYNEGQPVTADVEFWPIALVDVTPQQTTHPVPAPPADQPLIWSGLSWVVGGTDYVPILAGVTVTITNNLQRIGTRKFIVDASGDELAISRTPYKILPGIERVQVTYRLHDRLPTELAKGGDWGQVILRAEQPGVGAGRQYLEIRINNNFLNRQGMADTPAGQPITFTADTVGRAVEIEAGVTAA